MSDQEEIKDKVDKCKDDSDLKTQNNEQTQFDSKQEESKENEEIQIAQINQKDEKEQKNDLIKSEELIIQQVIEDLKEEKEIKQQEIQKQQEKHKEQTEELKEGDINQVQEKQHTIIKGTQRADGTFRKDIKIRAGYKNAEMVQKYIVPQKRQQ